MSWDLLAYGCVLCCPENRMFPWSPKAMRAGPLLVWGQEGGVAFPLHTGHLHGQRGVPGTSMTPAPSGHLLEKQTLRPHPGEPRSAFSQDIDPKVDSCAWSRVGSSVLAKAPWPALHPSPATFCSHPVTSWQGFALGRPKPLEWPPFYWSAYRDLLKFLECLGNSGFNPSDFSISDIRRSRAFCPHGAVLLGVGTSCWRVWPGQEFLVGAVGGLEVGAPIFKLENTENITFIISTFSKCTV